MIGIIKKTPVYLKAVSPFFIATLLEALAHVMAVFIFSLMGEAWGGDIDLTSFVAVALVFCAKVFALLYFLIDYSNSRKGEKAKKIGILDILAICAIGFCFNTLTFGAYRAIGFFIASFKYEGITKMAWDLKRF